MGINVNSDNYGLVTTMDFLKYLVNPYIPIFEFKYIIL